MAIGKGSDFQIYEPEFYGGQVEVYAQNLGLFGSGSNGAVVMESRLVQGDFEKESFNENLVDVITRRDLDSVAPVDDTAMTQGEEVGVKINKKAGPIAHTKNAWRKIGSTPQEMSFVLGQMLAVAKLRVQVNTAVLAIVAALEGQSDLIYDGSAGTLTHGVLNSGNALMGDASGRIIAYVMHSKPWHDLIGQAITDKIVDVASIAIHNGITATLGRPVIVLDVPALFDANGTATDTYNTIALVAGACEITESEEEDVIFEDVSGKEQIAARFQSEFAFNIRQKGFAWDIANGGANPTDGALGTTTNWDKARADDKDLTGVLIVTQ